MDGLDLKKLEEKKSRFVSMEEALKDVIPIDWGEDVLNGKVKVVVRPARPDSEGQTE